ncbi:MAG: peptidoglycan-binding domain-containing protein [Eubacteriaceae bacterium]
MLYKKKILISFVLLLIILISIAGSVSAAPDRWYGNLSTIRQGSHGGCVRAAQNICRHNLEWYHVNADGAFGPITNSAVREFQKKHRLAVDGIVGKYTWGKMQGQLYHAYNGVYCIKHFDGTPTNGTYFMKNGITNDIWNTYSEYNSGWYTFY